MNNTGGSAFPTTKPLDSWGDPNQGMTLRDYFAGQAMLGILTNNRLEDCDDFVVASNAYQMADFMLKAREA